MTTEQNGRINMAKHILPSSGNLLGLCFAILSFIKVSGLSNTTIIDQVLVIAIVLFLSASIVSYASMKSQKNGANCERIAEFIFLMGLVLIGACAVAVGIELVQ
ncbi:MAG TPA: hypothetical protein VK445_00875 [Dissulfurispiraceae bacterium]|nr:hypothetical protein [Dissulfurispiraceae bacterium]